ncbi:unnamed protein product [Adineta steineri]|uniref:Tektin n=2 Tax=Adineta steineri TaxID=433720 RepID=A0A814AWR0_9BILA|nr:unnamed protein product [Adineta steineri]
MIKVESETMSNEIITKYLNGTTDDIELDLLLAKTTTLSSSLSLLNQLINEVKYLDDCFIEQQGNDFRFEQEQERLLNMKNLLKRLLENIQVFDTRFRKLQLLLIASREQQQCYQAELDDFFRLVDKRLITDVEGLCDSSSNQRCRLISILEKYEHELDRLRQIRLCERQIVEQQNMTSKCRMQNTFLEKNQRKLLDKIKELNIERRQLIESSTQKRNRRRAMPTVQVEQQQKKPPLVLPPLSESVLHQQQQRLTRSRSLPYLKCSNNGRKSRIDDVEAKRREVERQLAETEKPLRIAQENLYEREKRQGIDLVHDGVERELIREIDTIKLNQQKLRQMLERLNTQNALNRAALHELEVDAQDKFRARVLDSAAHNIKTTSRGINFYHGIEGVDNTVSVPESWARHTEENIRRTLSEISQSDELLNQSNQQMATSNNDMWSQWNHVNVSLENRVQEEQIAKNKIQAHLEKILQEIFDVEQNIEFVKKTIADKEQFLQVAQTRLETRTRRPNVEACRDPAMHRLIQEVHDCHAAIADLHGKLRQEENAVQHLLRTKSTLEQDLAIKNNSLFIDSDKVMGIRRTYTMAAPERSSTTSVSFSHPRGLITA